MLPHQTLYEAWSQVAPGFRLDTDNTRFKPRAGMQRAGMGGQRKGLDTCKRDWQQLEEQQGGCHALDFFLGSQSPPRKAYFCQKNLSLKI